LKIANLQITKSPLKRQWLKRCFFELVSRLEKTLTFISCLQGRDFYPIAGERQLMMSVLKMVR
jgi:hypothetical protein